MTNDHTNCTHPYQRAALTALQQHVSMSVTDIAEYLASREHDDITDVPEEEVADIENELRRIHIPELEERSHVRYDETREVVSLLGRGADARVDVSAGVESAVDLATPAQETVEVELAEQTLKDIHDAMVNDEDLDPRMSYDEVISVLADD